MYCVYTDRDVPAQDGNWDHVFPLSLGGLDQFVVWSEEKLNSTMGALVDGALAKDPLIAMAVARSPVKGHGKKQPVRWRHASIDGRPAQVKLTPDQIEVWDARDRRALGEDEIAGREFTTRLTIGRFTAMRYLAKVALGGGYFVYGDALLDAIDCGSLRKIIVLDAKQAKTDSALLQCEFQVCDRFHPDAAPGGPGYLYRVLCEQLDRSVFITEPHANGIAFHVGVVGEFIGTLFCPGDTSAIPTEDGDHARGHVILLGPGSMERYSLEEVLLDLQTALGGDQMAAGERDDTKL